MTIYNIVNVFQMFNIWWLNIDSLIITIIIVKIIFLNNFITDYSITYQMIYTFNIVVYNCNVYFEG